MKTLPKRILAIRLSAMGDVAIIVPAIDAMRRQYPETELYVLTNKVYAPFFDNINGVHFIGIELKNYNGLRGLYKLYKELKVYNFNLIADLHNVIRSKIIRLFFKMSGVETKFIDKGRKEKKALTCKTNKQFVQLQTSAERYADVFRASGFDLKLNFKSIYTNNIILSQKVKDVIKVDRPLIGIAPFAKHIGKIYPLKKMEDVVKYYNDKELQIFLFGGASDICILDMWASKYKNCTLLVGKLNLSEELQLISLLNVMLTMDSGNMHLASLVNTPVVSVWGATHPYAGFYGWGQNPENIVQIKLNCRPCSIYGNKTCYRHDYACLNKISAEMIIEKINHVLISK